MNIIIEQAELLEELKIDFSVSGYVRFAMRVFEIDGQQTALSCFNNMGDVVRRIERKAVGLLAVFPEFPSKGLEGVLINLGDEYDVKMKTKFVLEESILECMLKSIRFQYANGNLCSLLEFHLSCVIGRNIHVLSIDKNGDMSLYDKKITGQQLALPKISMEGIEKFVFEVKKDGQEKKKANSVYSIGLWPERKADVKVHKRWRKRG